MMAWSWEVRLDEVVAMLGRFAGGRWECSVSEERAAVKSRMAVDMSSRGLLPGT